MSYRSDIVNEDSGFTWKDAFISFGIAVGTAAVIAVGASYWFVGSVGVAFKIFS